MCTAEKTILSNSDIKELIGDKCDGVIGQLTEVPSPLGGLLLLLLSPVPTVPSRAPQHLSSTSNKNVQCCLAQQNVVRICHKVPLEISIQLQQVAHRHHIGAMFGLIMNGGYGVPQGWTSDLFEPLKAAGGRVYSNYAVGYNNVDVPAATKSEVAVGNTPGGLQDRR